MFKSYRNSLEKTITLHLLVVIDYGNRVYMGHTLGELQSARWCEVNLTNHSHTVPHLPWLIFFQYEKASKYNLVIFPDVSSIAICSSVLGKQAEYEIFEIPKLSRVVLC